MPINIASQAVHSTDSSFKKFFKGFFAWNGKQYTILKSSTADKVITYREESIKNVPLSIFKVALCFTLVVPLLAFLYQRIDAQKLKGYIFTQEVNQNSPIYHTATKVEAAGNEHLSTQLETEETLVVLFDPKEINDDDVKIAKLLIKNLNSIPEAKEALTLFQQNKWDFEVAQFVMGGECLFSLLSETLSFTPDFLAGYQRALQNANGVLTEEVTKIHTKVLWEVKKGNLYKPSVLPTQPVKPEYIPGAESKVNQGQSVVTSSEQYVFFVRGATKKVTLPTYEKGLPIGYKNTVDEMQDKYLKAIATLYNPGTAKILDRFFSLSQNNIINEMFIYSSIDGSFDWSLEKKTTINIGSSINLAVLGQYINPDEGPAYEDLMKLIRQAVLTYS